jgi:hypothetical protein
MSEAPPVDLSPLDPARDPDRWALIVQQTRTRVDAVFLERERQTDVLTIVAGWARPVLATAAAALLLLGASVAARSRTPPPHASGARSLAALSAGYADGHVPTGAELAAALGARGTRR